jgi:hypothetical protein
MLMVYGFMDFIAHDKACGLTKVDWDGRYQLKPV